MKTEPLEPTVALRSVAGQVDAGKAAGRRVGEGNRAAGTPRRSALRTSPRRTGVYVGLLFLFQMVTFMIGSSLVDGFVAGNAPVSTLRIGVFLEMCSGLAIVAIGFLMYPLLKLVDEKVAPWYPALRLTEFAVSAGCAVYLLTRLELVPNYLLWIYVPTGLGGLVLSYLLYVSRMVPRPIALLGLAGYGLFLVGVPIDLLSSLDMNAGPGLALLALGGLFELVVFPAWLLSKGFRMPGSATR